MIQITTKSTLTGLTLIEIMITMFVFGVGILSVLTMITQNISLVDRVKTQTNASIYAKEGIELVYQLRNTNILLARARNCAIPNPDAETEQELCQQFFLSGDSTEGLLIGFDPVQTIQVEPINLSGLAWTGLRSQAQLYKHEGILLDDPLLTGTRVNHTKISGTAGGYARVITFDPVILTGGGESAPTNALIKVSSNVYTSIGSQTGSFVLESFIGKR